MNASTHASSDPARNAVTTDGAGEVPPLARSSDHRTPVGSERTDPIHPLGRFDTHAVPVAIAVAAPCIVTEETIARHAKSGLTTASRQSSRGLV